MKKKIYALILVLFIIPTIFIFNGCKKEEESRLISSFYDNYLQISESSPLLTTSSMPEKFNKPNDLIVSFIYSQELRTKISTIPAYSYIKSLYNTMLEDAMGPTFLYGNMLNKANLSNKDISYLYRQLDILKTNYIEIATRLGDLERGQNTATANASLSKLYTSYEDAILTAISISSKISSIYYKKILINPNVDYLSIADSKINLEDIAIKTLNRLAYYKLAYVDIFLETQILGCDVPTKIINNTFNSSYEPYENTKNKTYSNVVVKDLEPNRSAIIELARTLYCIQLVFEDEYTLYQTACEKIVYGITDNKSSETDIGYKQIIDSFIGTNGIAVQSYLTVSQILDLCY